MTSSGTYDFGPANSAFVLNAFDRIQIRPSALLVEHMQRASIEANLLLAEWANRGVNLWKSELLTSGVTSGFSAITQGTATYTLPARTVSILVAYVSTLVNGTSTDRILSPISTFEYGAIPQKTIQAPPTVYWYNRQITPQITLWGVPNLSSTYTLNLQVMAQVEDNGLASGQTPNIPYRWYDCFTAGLAYRLARIYMPALEDKRKMDYTESWSFAASEDTEDVNLYIYPGLGSYYR
jgi:hypothetical protein|tara:strand:- start:2050 stop:2760 length:711 start_codon:yes stop_codon:yes gene_type:complete